MSRARIAYLSLGSNVGDRLARLSEAAGLLSSAQGITPRRVAPVYETEPVGVRDQPWFLNTVVEVETSLSPHALLDAAKRVEAAVGRTPTYRWGPREVDVDILLFGGERVADDRLIIPHPRMKERLFVLLPLRDLKPDWRDERGTGIDELIERLADTAEVIPFGQGLGG